ncbi:hypothetical protein QT381_10805 [Galbitalea sp. SE-J8]|uniref:hypothetical protein n=1 Tax=Galbitalea sp. SE-J8 TaxID=3054952 RepID=UPI00259CE745|nr:hypothetical protein [Galbitalea sp. SE-J8]MDM4763499.1 hypothetical protein [Galbitalea sp. SE-J8]
MPDADGFYPPVEFSPLWLLLAAAIVVALVAYLVLSLALTRPRATTPDDGDPLAAGDLRISYLLLIDEVGVAYREGRLSAPEAHQRLSLVVREFAARMRGIRAPYMTLADLREQRIDPLADTVAELYPGAFGAGPGTPSVELAAARARELVGGWR